jgi:hypothetical protein
LEATGEVRELSEDESRRLLERDPELLHQYRKFTAVGRARGRLIVTDQLRVSEILAWLDTGT